MKITKREKNTPKEILFSELEVGELFVRAGNLAIKTDTNMCFWLGGGGYPGVIALDTGVFRAAGELSWWLV